AKRLLAYASFRAPKFVDCRCAFASVCGPSFTWREAGSQSRQHQEGSTHRQDAAGNRPCFLRPSDRLLFSRNKAIIAIGKNVASILCQNKSKANRENSPESRLAAAAVHCVRVSGFGCLRERGRGNVAHRRSEDRHLHLA